MSTDVIFIYSCSHREYHYDATSFSARLRQQLYRINDPYELGRPGIPFDPRCEPATCIYVNGLCSGCGAMLRSGWRFGGVLRRAWGL